MFSKLFILVLLLPSSFSAAAVCAAPEFAESIFDGTKAMNKTSVPLNVAGIMKLALPAGFEGAALSSDATVFAYPDKARLVIGIETAAAIAPHKRNAKPEPFYRDIFMGRTRLGCRYLAEYRLEQQEYRIRGKAGVMDILAFGKGDSHEAIVLHPGRPDVVVRMRFSGYDRPSVEAMLSAITPQ